MRERVKTVSKGKLDIILSCTLTRPKVDLQSSLPLPPPPPLPFYKLELKNIIAYELPNF